MVIGDPDFLAAAELLDSVWEIFWDFPIFFHFPLDGIYIVTILCIVDGWDGHPNRQNLDL